MENREITTERKHIKIQVLTPVHIGSGEILQKGLDYIEYADENDDNFVYVFNQKELFKKLVNKGITIEQLSSELAKNGSIEGYVNTNLEGVSIDKYSQRSIFLVDSNSGAKELRSHLHNGFGNPLIPGSSLKGAIHTAIFPKVRGKEAEMMKFLKISDASFEQEGMDALNMTLLNIRESKSFDDRSKKQLVEAITSGEESECVIKISDTTTFPYQSIEKLFKQVNSTTKQILDSEINFWENDSNWNVFDNVGNNYELVNSYLEKCSSISQEIKSLDEKSCILRIGNSNGWKFITGTIESNTSEVRGRVRIRREYEKYPFPKSRRINVLMASNDIDEVQLLGFVKLTIKD